MRRLVLLLACLAAFSCRHDDAADAAASSGDEAETGRPVRRGSSRAELCVETTEEFLQMPYDTNGDGAADVIRIYRMLDNGRSRRIVCREADLNGDGVRDVMRTYDSRGRVAREQQDRDFDGFADYWEYYQDGRMIRIDQDTNHDQRIDTRIFLDVQEHPSRIERDLAGRSTPGHWQADHYEFYDEGRLTRAGEDVDLDGTVDRWDRDMIYQAERDRRQHEADLQERRERALRSDASIPEDEPDAGVADAGTSPSRGADAGGALAARPDSGIR